MSKEIETNIPGFKLRILMPSAIISAFSTTEPIVTKNPDTGRIANVEISQDPNSGFGDIIGFIDWSQVNSISWRRAEGKKPPGKPGRPRKETEPELSADETSAFFDHLRSQLDGR